MVHVDISNVAAWFFEVNQQSVYDIAEDFPIILSPWEHVTFAYQEPRRINIDGVIEKRPPPYSRIEIEVRTGQVTEQERDEYRGRWGDWIEEAAYFQSLKGSALWNGRVAAGDYFLMAIDGQGRGSREVIYPPGGSAQETAWFYPVFFAISLTHCRNVEVRDRPVSRQQRRMAERTGKPVTVYKELVIDAFRKQARYETEGDGGNEIKRALHICRGHFATYGDHNPLFGKHTGTFWRPMHVRGHKEIGEVKKSYNVKGPK